jgi:hypothetical protein
MLLSKMLNINSKIRISAYNILNNKYINDYNIDDDMYLDDIEEDENDTISHYLKYNYINYKKKDIINNVMELQYYIKIHDNYKNDKYKIINHNINSVSIINNGLNLFFIHKSITLDTLFNAIVSFKNNNILTDNSFIAYIKIYSSIFDIDFYAPESLKRNSYINNIEEYILLTHNIDYNNITMIPIIIHIKFIIIFLQKQYINDDIILKIETFIVNMLFKWVIFNNSINEYNIYDLCCCFYNYIINMDNIQINKNIEYNQELYDEILDFIITFPSLNINYINLYDL